MSRALYAAALALLVAGCSGAPGEPALFPLNKGWRWTYQMTTETPAGSRQERFVVENRGAAIVGDSLQALERRNSLGNAYYFVNDASGIYRVASRAEIERVAQPDEDPLKRFVLRTPVAKGTRWQSLTKPFLLRRAVEFPNELKYGKPILMEFEIEAVDESVTVPAGKFEHCVVVSGRHTINLYLDPVTGLGQVPIKQREWYCPNAGMVRFVRAEPLKERYFTGGTVSFELAELKR